MIIEFIELILDEFDTIIFSVIIPCVYAHWFYKQHRIYKLYPEAIGRKFMRVNLMVAITGFLLFALIETVFRFYVKGLYDELSLALIMLLTIYMLLSSFYFKRRRKGNYE